MTRTWVEIPDGSDFTAANLPFGMSDGLGAVVAIGDRAVALDGLQRAGLVVDLPDGIFVGPSLNPFLALGRPAWRAVRERVAELLADGNDELAGRPDVDRLVVDRHGVRLLLPIAVADYVDFYSSLNHATNLGRLFRPDSEPLLPNWRRLPVGYHGRSGTIVVTGTDVRRPRGQVLVEGQPRYWPSASLDIELEVAAVVGVGSPLGAPVDVDLVADHVVGLVLLNDWSARDIQAFEYQPLGPFLGKSFATSISPWIVTLDALEPFRVAPPPQDPPVEEYLRSDQPWAFDLQLEVLLETAAMRAASIPAEVISTTTFATMYWTVAQQVAHTTANGASLRTGDLLGSGTVSGPDARSEAGSLIELTWRGEHPLELPTGETRAFLADGDRVVLRGWAGQGDTRVGFGEVSGTIIPAL